jgi:hypothetical protein
MLTGGPIKSTADEYDLFISNTYPQSALTLYLTQGSFFEVSCWQMIGWALSIARPQSRHLIGPPILDSVHPGK